MNAKTTGNRENLSKILKSSHQNKWVAISHDYKKVIAFADNLVDLDRKVKNPMQVIYTRVLAKDISFAPIGL